MPPILDPGRAGRRAALALAVAGLVLGPAHGAAQEPIPPPDTTVQDTAPAPAPPDSARSVVRRPVQDSATADSVPPPRPGNAFLRSVLLPGWGQATYDAYFRGGVYYAGWAGAWFMNIKNAAKLGEARELRAVRQRQVVDSLQVVAATDTMIAAILADTARAAELAEIIAADSAVNELRKLVDSRKQQRQDWIALTIFWTLASGIDAFVTAHLSDFPATVGITPEPGGGASLRVEVPFPRRRR